MKSYQAVYQILAKETDYISGEKSQKNYPSAEHQFGKPSSD